MAENAAVRFSALLFGAVRGLIVSRVYFIAQLPASGATAEIKQIAVAIVWMAGFGPGFVFDRTLKQLGEGKLKLGGRDVIA